MCGLVVEWLMPMAKGFMKETLGAVFKVVINETRKESVMKLNTKKKLLLLNKKSGDGDKVESKCSKCYPTC